MPASPGELLRPTVQGVRDGTQDSLSHPGIQVPLLSGRYFTGTPGGNKPCTTTEHVLMTIKEVYKTLVVFVREN